MKNNPHGVERWRYVSPGWWRRRISCRCKRFNGAVRTFAVYVVRVAPAQPWEAKASIWTGDVVRVSATGWGRTRHEAVDAVQTALRNGWREAGTACKPSTPRSP